MSNLSLYNMDVFKFLNTLDAATIDCCLTDPPYSSLNKWRAMGTTTRLKTNGWFDTIPNEQFPILFEEFYRVLKPNSHLYMFCDADTMFSIKPMGEAAGFKFRRLIVWDKDAIGMGYFYRMQTEYILFFEKGKKRVNNLSISNLIRQKRLLSDFPTEKPVPVSEVLIKQSSKEQEIILDPFMGSGSVGEAALKNNRYFIGNDLSEKAFEVASARLLSFNKENA